MTVLIIFLTFGFLSISSSLPANDASKTTNNDSQSKRDLSLSYAATDIGSKDGSRAKTITVIKNIAGKKDESLKIDPKLHKSENWGSQFRDNFDSYGVIPDVPDIDDLFDFVNKKKESKPTKKEEEVVPAKKPEEKEEKPNKGKEEPKEEQEPKEEVTPAPVAPVEEDANEPKEEEEEKVEKIAGDAEFIQPPGKQGKVKSQSLDLGKYRVRENSYDDDDDNYSSPPQYLGRQQHFSNSGNKNEKYIQPHALLYNYPDPNLKGYLPAPANGYSQQGQVGRGSITVTTPSGRSFDIPFGNSTASPPYLAPNFRRNPNSLPGSQFPTSSQRPYVAPNLRKNYDVQLNNTVPSTAAVTSNCGSNSTSNRQPPSTLNGFRNIATNIRTDSLAGYKPNKPRSRGLRY